MPTSRPPVRLTPAGAWARPTIFGAAIAVAALPSPRACNLPPPHRAELRRAALLPATGLLLREQVRWPVNHHHKWVKTSTNRRLRGVAAKYLDDCLAWMRMREWFEDGTDPEHSTVSGLGQQIINR